MLVDDATIQGLLGNRRAARATWPAPLGIRSAQRDDRARRAFRSGPQPQLVVISLPFQLFTPITSSWGELGGPVVDHGVRRRRSVRNIAMLPLKGSHRQSHRGLTS